MVKVCLVDGTLREGEQAPGVHFTQEEKIRIARELDGIGVPLLDVGMPSISPEEREAIRAITDLELRASVGVSIRLKQEEVDQSVACNVDEVFLICPVSHLHIRSKLGMDEEGMRQRTEEITRYAVTKQLLVNLVAEDASRADVPFLCMLLRDAFGWGARRVFLCDTVGRMEPVGMKGLVEEVKRHIPEEMGIGIHCHNDFGLATANTLAAVEAGADYPSVTVNGIGERAGNPPLHEVVMALEKLYRREHGIDTKRLYALSRLVEACSGIFISPHAPMVGLNAFRHESGVHVDGILKHRETYNGVDPHAVGRHSSFVLGKHSGTQVVRHLLEERGCIAGEGQVREILRRVKEGKIQEEKVEIQRMVRETETYYERCLTFPLDAFWRIVEEVLRENG